MTQFDDYPTLAERQMPVILLLDTSGSMGGSKIQTLNEAVSEMITELAKVDDGVGFLRISVITFGGQEATELIHHAPVGEILSPQLTARGRTPMGSAFALAQQLIENDEELPSNAYRPTLALVSDGIPTDKGWQDRLQELISSERGEKSTRLAVAVGPDADREMLRTFMSGVEPHEASEASGIADFLQFVTMTVTQSTQPVGQTLEELTDTTDVADPDGSLDDDAF